MLLFILLRIYSIHKEIEKMLVVTYKRQYEDYYVERTAIFATKWAFQKELEKYEQEGNSMIVTGMWCW